MDLIPPTYWMIIITFIAGLICFVLFELGMLLKESKDTVKESRSIIAEAQYAVKSANEILSVVKDTVYEVNASVIGPVRRISSLLTTASSFVEGLTSKRR